jgi:three-Cys-motif partner protein
LNAATGEVCVDKSKREIVLGSAGHALRLKAESSHTENLKVILIEENSDCYEHLRRVIDKRWRSISTEQAEGPITSNASGVYLLNKNLDDALNTIGNLSLGNAIYYFDPLRSVEWNNIEKVAGNRMRQPFQTGTEVIVFLFTSDWFLGRDDFAPLPSRRNSWAEEEKKTVAEADALFGNEEWQESLLNGKPIEKKQNIMIELYKARLHRWFRYVLTLPFNPKKDELFHLIMCSNYEVGVVATKGFYSSKTGNPKYAPDNAKAFERFKGIHPGTMRNLTRRKRPLQWLTLWKIVKSHEEGLCDFMCKDFSDLEPSVEGRKLALKWLSDKGYLESIEGENAWGVPLNRYKLNWKIVKKNLRVPHPPSLKPISAL